MSEERDLEQELKEEKDRYEQQNQEAYDEETKGNEELRRRAEEAEKKNKIQGFDSSTSMLDEEFERQKKLQEDDQTAEEQFDEAQQGLRDANTAFQRFLGIVGALQNNATGIVSTIFDSIGKDNYNIVTPEQPIIEDVPTYPTVIQRILKVKKDNPEVFSNIFGKAGGFSEEDQKKIDKIQKDIRVNRPQGDQLNLFFGETDAFLSQQYANLRKQEGDPIPTKLSTAKARRQVTRKIKVSDLDLILQEFPDIPKDKANEYIQAIREEERGENLVAGSPRKGGNGKGLIGTLRWLNSVAMAPNSKTPSDINVKDIADELSAEFNQIITVKTLDNIIQEKGSIPVEIADREIMQVTDLDSLIAAYVRRIERYNSIPAFEAGHVFAAKNIMEDFNIPKNEKLANYKGNLEPEIARSIYSMVDDQALTDLLKGTDLEAVVIGNRGRKDESDPDKVIAALYGRDYGLRESFLNFVYPERSLKNKIRDDLKSTFTDIYKEEMELALSDFDARGGGKGTISPRILDVIRTRVLRDRVMPYFEEEGLQEVMEALTLTSDKISGRSMVADEDELLSRNLLKKQEIRRKGEMK